MAQEDREQEAGAKRIVVGIDDSANARAALRWALDNAAPRDEIVAVHAWHLPVMGGFEMALTDPAPFEAGAEKLLADVVADVVSGDDESDRIRCVTRSGASTEVVLAEAADADLLVVGARGHGGFTGLLLGSVTSTLMHHTPCPTVVVPVPDRVTV
jgi:nucleotide-binding universal stress UspA family protein